MSHIFMRTCVWEKVTEIQCDSIFWKQFHFFFIILLLLISFIFLYFSLVLIFYFSFQFLLILNCQECSSFLTEFTASIKEHSLSVDQEQIMLELLTNFNLLNEELHAGKFSTLPLFRWMILCIKIYKSLIYQNCK